MKEKQEIGKRDSKVLERNKTRDGFINLEHIFLRACTVVVLTPITL